MEGKQDSTGNAAWKQTLSFAGRSIRRGAASVTQATRWALGKSLPFCRDHLLSFVLLLAIPLGVAAFFWNGPKTENSPDPVVLQDGTELEPAFPSPPSGVQLAGGYAVDSTPPPIPEAPNVLPFPTAATDAEFGGPHPLPIAVETPPFATDELQPTWNLPASAEFPESPNRPGGAWLTGTIEDLDRPAQPMPGRSRVHELTSPIQNYPN